MTRAPDSADTVVLPAMQLPGFRSMLAISRGVEKNILVRTWGGIGDQACAEPTLRWITRHFKGCKVSLASELPELFAHLDFTRVFDLRHEQPLWHRYLMLNTIDDQNGEKELSAQFFNHLLMHCVDYSSVCALRSQIPVADRAIVLEPGVMDRKVVSDHLLEQWKDGALVAIHPGRHWQSKTFPATWWDRVIACVARGGATPVIIGSDADDNRGTVAIDKVALADAGAIDLRGKLQLMETVALLQRARVLLTNDSAPLHLAACGRAWIGFVATCKHPDFITHWRRSSPSVVEWSWRMENLGCGGVWEHVEQNPGCADSIKVEHVSDALLLSWLPDPEYMAAWAVLKTKENP